MSECYLHDDDGISDDIIAVEGVPDGADTAPQALWAGVRPVYYGSEPSKEPMIHVSYQEAYMDAPLTGLVWLTPGVWRELNRSVEKRLRRRGHGKWRTRLRGVLRRR